MSVLKENLRRLVSDLKKKTVWILLMNILKENLRSLVSDINRKVCVDIIDERIERESAQFF
jgi:hypothetical protein